MLKKLDPLVEGTAIYGRDSNTALDQGLEKSRPPGSQLTHPPKRCLKLAKLIFKYGLVDAWREMNTTKKDYTHFSCPHQSYVKIDHIFISTSELSNVTKSYIRDTVWSDHSIVLLILNRSLDRPTIRNWRLNKSILSDPIRVMEIKKGIKEYFHLNNTAELSPETLWAAHKATIRGKLIQISTQIKREIMTDIHKLETEFSQLQIRQKQDTKLVPMAKLDAARLSLNLALTTKAEKNIRWSGAKFYHKE